ncbi:hypothetical protein EDF56_105505 [Novosphingobium sp. PhB165]|nr:hypothetical protein EDF56_105505 [Novosphingobium sp. PhB165]
MLGNSTAPAPSNANGVDLGCAVATEDRRSDLCAQWKAADAAQASANWTLWTVWLGLFGLCIGFGTLIAAAIAAFWAKRAAEYTKAGAVEAKRSADAAKEANRPWLRMEIEEAGRLHVESDYLSVFCDVSIDNFGNSPALEVWADGILSFDVISLSNAQRELSKFSPRRDHPRSNIFPKAPEATQLIVEFRGEISQSGTLFLMVYCLYRIPGDVEWRYAADIQEIMPGDAATRQYAMDGKQMRFEVSAGVMETRGIAFKRAMGILPAAT